jgi:hypothetical protein
VVKVEGKTGGYLLHRLLPERRDLWQGRLRIGDRVVTAKELPPCRWDELDERQRKVTTGKHRQPGARGTIEYLTHRLRRGPTRAEGPSSSLPGGGVIELHSAEVRHTNGRLVAYLASELELDEGTHPERVHPPSANVGDGPSTEQERHAHTAKRMGMIDSMRDCLLELAGEPAESETIAELVARVRETVKRPTQIVMQLREELEPEEIAGVAAGMQSFGAGEDSPQERIAAALEELAVHESGEQSAPLGEASEPLCFKHEPLAECAAGGGDCKGCDDELKPGGPGQRGAEIRAAATPDGAIRAARAFCELPDEADGRQAAADALAALPMLLHLAESSSLGAWARALHG